MTTEELLYIPLYVIAGLAILFFLRRVWQNFQARQGLDRQVLRLEHWAKQNHWSVVDRTAKSPWRRPYEETSGTVSIIPKAVALGNVVDISGVVAVAQVADEMDDESNPNLVGNVTYWRFPIRPVGGWLRLRSARSRFKGQIKEVRMESLDFNRDVQVHAYPTKLAYDLLSPDFMEWYLRSSQQPWIHVNDGVVLIVYELQGEAPNFDHQFAEVKKILHHVST